MESIKNEETKIVVCVDMFGEGIDIPNLKIAAIHNKYKSLPITLQFIGRFARKKSGLGNATIVANIADDDIKEALRELYAQDSDWNILLKSMSTAAINKEISLQELTDGFSKLGLKNLDIKQLVPKVSMIAFKTGDQRWKWQNWTKAFNEDVCRCCVHEEKKVLVIIEPQESKVDWANNREISDINWQLHILYWDSEKKMVFINSTDKSKCNRLVESIFDNFKKVQGESIFKCLYDIKRLMFGTGYSGKGRVSIGCSYKGTIWSRWVESIDFWIKWCNDIADKINNPSIDVDAILKGALSPKIILTRPKVVPYSIEWPLELTVCNEERIKVITSFDEYPIYEVELGLLNNDEEKPIQFYIGNKDFKEQDSVQYKVISNLKDKNRYEIIFDDDNAGEIADVITIKEEENKICFELYHCKFSHGGKPGSRVGDLYEVCGQAEKSVAWKQNGRKIIDRMIKRENHRLKKGLPSRIEMGGLRKLKEINNKLSVYDYNIKINIVQPGVDAKKISAAMNELLCGTKAYLMDTFSLEFKIICS